MKHALIVTPIFYGDSGGASIYYQQLVHGLNSLNIRTTVVSEEIDRVHDGSYLGLFPRRCSEPAQYIRDRVLYAIQNVRYLRLSGIIRSVSPESVLVHSGFYAKPGLFGLVYSRLRREFPNIRFVADVRDRLMTSRAVRTLNAYDDVIACSQNVARFLLENGLAEQRLLRIPVIQDVASPSQHEVDSVLRAHHLSGQRFILYAGLLKESKGLDLLLGVFDRMRKTEPKLSLVLCGLLKTTDPSMRRKLSKPGIAMLGPQPQGTVLALMQHAALCINLAPNEGLPRFSLEAIALRRPCILPPNIPEFETYCPGYVANTTNADELARMSTSILREARVPSYPIAMHRSSNVLPQYQHALFPERRFALAEPS